MVNSFYLKGAGKKSRRKSKKKSDITPEETDYGLAPYQRERAQRMRNVSQRVDEKPEKEGKNLV